MNSGHDDELEKLQAALDEDAAEYDRLRAAEKGTIPLGIALAALGHVFAFAATLAIDVWSGTTEAVLLWFLFIGATQVVYIVPLTVWADVRIGRRTAKGVGIGAAITALLNAGCFGIGLARFGS